MSQSPAGQGWRSVDADLRYAGRMIVVWAIVIILVLGGIVWYGAYRREQVRSAEEREDDELRSAEHGLHGSDQELPGRRPPDS